jgi:hypothetical protein
MGAMRTATVPLVSKGSACKAVMKITQSDEDTMVVCTGMTNRKPNAGEYCCGKNVEI